MRQSLLAVILLVAGCATAAPAATPSPAAASPSTPPTAAPTATAAPATGTAAGDLVVSVSADGYLVGPNGHALYVFDNDSVGTSACTGGCADNWPPLTTTDGQHVAADPSASGTFGSIARSDGSTQVTFNDRPLYYYGGDSAPGDRHGDGINGVWHLATASNPASVPASNPAEPSPTEANSAEPSPTATDPYHYNY